MEAQGRLIGTPVAIADGVYIGLAKADNVVFSCYLAGAAGDTYTLTSAQDAAGTGAAVLAAITRYTTSDGVGGAVTQRTQAAASTMVTAAVTAQNGAVLEVSADSLPAGHKFVKLTSTGAGLVHAFVTDLRYGKSPARLPSVIA